MATKTFKIGLSNTDKQNMAQDVYERLLALTFPEYDSAEEYNVGDFVVYNDQLYKCIGATTGVWDSTKWQLATLNDLVTDIEGAVAFVNNKANVDGNYPTMTVGEADNLTPYDEEAGAEQNKPFFFQATGTANGSDPDFVTGSAALMREKRGNTVVVNQMVNANGTSSYGIVATITNGHHVSLRGTSTYSGGDNNLYIELLSPINLIEGHKYLSFCTNNNWNLFIYGASQSTHASYSVEILTSRATEQGGATIRPNNNNVIANGTVIREEFDIYLIDLTQLFNGNIPQDLLDHPDHFFRYYQGSLAYNEGTLVNANSRYIKCIGRQQWDEEWEVGNIDSDGQNETDSTRIRSKNYTRVVPGLPYYAKCPSEAYLNIFFYDKDKNFIGALDNSIHNTHFETPDNCCYIRFGTYLYGSTYNNDITISIYYDYESGYDKYYPYEELTNNDTGTEVLRRIDDQRYDVKLPSGLITRKVGNTTISNNMVLGMAGTNYGYNNITYLRIDNPDDALVSISKRFLSSIYGLAIYSNNFDSADYINKAIYNAINDEMWFGFAPDTTLEQAKAVIVGSTINYELATPTTEQGTSFSENLAIHDFGTMDFSDTSGVPQGNAIFYPVDYKAYLDTLHKYTEGDPDNLALKTDLPTSPNTYLTSLSGYDATKTQVLKNVEGTLTWVTEGE